MRVKTAANRWNFSVVADDNQCADQQVVVRGPTSRLFGLSISKRCFRPIAWSRTFTPSVGASPAICRVPLCLRIDRFLYWVRSFTTDDDLSQHPIRLGDDLRSNIRLHVSKWFELPASKLQVDEVRLARIVQLQTVFADEEALALIQMDQLADMLQGCAAFVEMLRFTKGGLENHVKAFKTDNPIERARELQSLVFGSGDYVQRIYDCVYSPDLKLAHWVEIAPWSFLVGSTRMVFPHSMDAR